MNVRTKIMVVLVVLLGLLFSAGCYGKEKHSVENISLSNESLVVNLLAKMTLEEKLGQLIMIGFADTKITPELMEMLDAQHVGNIILFNRNMINHEQVSSLNASLQKIALEKQHKIPLFIAIDQEGGKVVRMPDSIKIKAPTQESIAQNQDTLVAKQWAISTAQELKEMGFNVNFAPVADVGGLYGRTYGTDPQKVYLFVKAAMEGYAQEGLICALKHFPGIGKSVVDLHDEEFVINTAEEVLIKEDLYPFSQAIKELDNSRFMLMTSHITYKAWDESFPASLSSKINNDLARKKMGFTGIVVSDDTEMSSLNNKYSFEEIGYMAMQSGVDITLVCHTLEHQKAVLRGMKRAVLEGKISIQELDSHVKRVVFNKLNLNIKVE